MILKPLSGGLSGNLGAFNVDSMWNLQAAIKVLTHDQNNDGKLNAQEYKAASLVQGDGYFASAARNYEFAVVDEVKLADGQVTMTELASFYQSMDSNKNGQHSREEFEGRINQSSWRTRFYHPIATFSNAISHYTRLFSQAF